MTQVASGESLLSKDVTSGGDKADAQYGVNATSTYAGEKGRLDEKFMGQVFASHFEKADRYRLRFVPEWLKGYQQYYGDLEDRGKGTWQNNINIPKPKQAVDTSAAKIVEALFQNEDFFDVLPFQRQQDLKVAMAKASVKWQMWKADARQGITTCTKDALICGNGFMKVYFDQELEESTSVKPKATDPFSRQGGPFEFTTQEKLVQKLALEPVLPTDIWLDPSGRGDYVIQRIRRSLSDVWALASDQKDSDGNVVIPAVYDPEVVRQLRAATGDQRSLNDSAVIRRDTPHLNEDNGIDLYEFWGNIRDPKNGVILFRNVLMTVAEKQWVVRMPVKNPYRHGKLPFIHFAPSESPHQTYGTSLLFPSLRVHDSLNRQWNVVLDKAMLQVPTVEVDPLAARNPEELMGDKMHFYPGKTWARKSGDRPIFFPVEGFPPITDVDMALIDRLSNVYDMGTQVNEFATGAVASNNRKTKEEVDQRSQAAQGVFNDAARHIEQHSLSPLLKIIYYLTIQFVDEFDDETLLSMFTDAPEAADFAQSMKTLTPEERWEQMYLDGEFRVTGISLSITRQDRLQRMSGFLKFLGAMPQLMQLVDQRTLLRDAMELFDMKRDLILPNQEAMTQAMENMQLQAMSNPASLTGGAGGAGGGSAVANNPNNQQQALQGQFNNAPAAETGGPQ